MAIAFVGAGTGAAGTSLPVTVGLPGSVQPGHMMALVCLTKNSPTPTINDLAGWTKPANYTIEGGAGSDQANGGLVRMSVLFREFQAGDAAPSVDASASSNPRQFQIFAWSKTAASWEAPVCVGAADTTGSTSGYDPPAASSVALRAGDWLGAATALNDDSGTPGTPTLTVPGVALGSLTNRGGGSTGLGNDSRFACHDAPVVSGTPTGGPDVAWPFTSTIADFAGCTVFFRLRETPQSTPGPAPELIDSSANTVDEAVSTTATINPPAGALLIIDVLTGRDTGILPPSLSGACITNVTQLAAVSAQIATQRHLTRFSAVATGTPGAITITYAATSTGRGWAIHQFTSASVAQTQTGTSGTNFETALSTGTLTGLGASSTVLVAWAQGLGTPINVEAGWWKTFEAGWPTVSALLATAYTAGDDTPTATIDSATSWLGIASEIAAPSPSTVDLTPAGLFFGAVPLDAVAGPVAVSLTPAELSLAAVPLHAKSGFVVDVAVAVGATRIAGRATVGTTRTSTETGPTRLGADVDGTRTRWTVDATRIDRED